jgi:hypothetical protein
MPAKGVSLHIGLNFVNPDHYGGWDGELKACEYDAKDLKAIAEGRGFKSTLLLTARATSDAVLAGILDAAKQLKSGDFFLLTYSGHGGQVPDTNGDETDAGRQDETWVLWDRQLVDDELWDLWRRFKAGVRIFVLSDSCHSGTVTRQMPAFSGSGPAPRIRMLPPKQAAKVYRQNRALYDGIQDVMPAAEKRVVRPSVILISGCQDNQYSLDGNRNGLFTATLKNVWRKGTFAGGYRRFRDEIARRMPTQQTPHYTLVGKPNPAFEAEQPFSV